MLVSETLRAHELGANVGLSPSRIGPVRDHGHRGGFQNGNPVLQKLQKSDTKSLRDSQQVYLGYRMESGMARGIKMAVALCLIRNDRRDPEATLD